MNPPGDRLDAFIAPARARPALWRLLLGAIFAVAAWFACIFLLFPLANRLPGDPGRLFLLAYLASFAGLAAGLAAAARFLQRRRPATLVGPGGFRPSHFAAGVAAIALVTALSVPFSSGLLLQQLPLATWAAWLPLALPLLLVQTAAEELAFRGYLMQGLAARFASPWVWFLLPALAFGALHWNPGEFGADAWVVVLSTTVIGLVLADVTVRTGNLSAAIGLHFANNVTSLLIVTLPGPLSGLGLFVVAPDPAAVRPLLVADLAVTLLAWAAWRGLARLHSRGGGSI
jgi:membrane protease YdiL (CAAX protease family)